MDKIKNNSRKSEISLEDYSCNPSNIIEKFSKILFDDVLR